MNYLNKRQIAEELIPLLFENNEDLLRTIEILEKLQITQEEIIEFSELRECNFDKQRDVDVVDFYTEFTFWIIESKYLKRIPSIYIEEMRNVHLVCVEYSINSITIDLTIWKDISDECMDSIEKALEEGSEELKSLGFIVTRE